MSLLSFNSSYIPSYSMDRLDRPFTCHLTCRIETVTLPRNPRVPLVIIHDIVLWLSIDKSRIFVQLGNDVNHLENHHMFDCEASNVQT